MSAAGTGREASTAGVGRGMLLLGGANAVYVLGGYALTVLLARELGASGLGGYGVVTGYVTVLTTLLVKGVPGAVTRAIADGDTDPATAWRAGASLLARTSLVLVAAGIVAAPLVALLLGDLDLAPMLAVGALGGATFGANAILLAWAVGTRDYGRQFVAQLAYSLLRVVFVLVGALVAGLWGAIVGYVLAPLASATPLLVRHPQPTGEIAAVRRQLRRAAVPVVVTAAAITAWFVIDVFALAAATGGASRHVGAYVAYGTLAHVPYFLLQATSVLMVPAIAAAARGDERRAAIRRTVTDTIVLVAGPTLLLVTAGDAAARVIFGSGFEVEGAVTAPLALATAAITLHAGLVAVDVAIGRLGPTVVLGATGVVAMVALASWSASRAEGDAPSMVAQVVLATAALTLLAHVAMELRRFGGILEARRALRGVAVAAVLALAPLGVEDDALRMAIAAVAGVTWLGVVVRFGLVDVRRSAPAAVVVADGEPA